MAVYLVTLIAAVVINSLVITIVCKSQRLRNPINYLIVNLAMADLLAPSFAIPRIIAERYDPSWAVKGPFGAFLCKFSSFLLDSPNCSVYSDTSNHDRRSIPRYRVPNEVPSPVTRRRCVIAITITSATGVPSLLTLLLHLAPDSMANWKEYPFNRVLWLKLETRIRHRHSRQNILLGGPYHPHRSPSRNPGHTAHSDNDITNTPGRFASLSTTTKTQVQRKPTNLENANHNISGLFIQLGPLPYTGIHFVLV